MSVGTPEGDEVFEVKIVYTDPQLRLFRAGKSLASVEFTEHLQDQIETRRHRAELERADEEYRDWLKSWRDHQRDTLNCFQKTRSQAWTHFKHFYDATKQRVLQH